MPLGLTSRGSEKRPPIPQPDAKPLYLPNPEACGYVYGDKMTSQKARLLLMVALTRTRDRAELQRIFSQY